MTLDFATRQSPRGKRNALSIHPSCVSQYVVLHETAQDEGCTARSSAYVDYTQPIRSACKSALLLYRFVVAHAGSRSFEGRLLA